MNILTATPATNSLVESWRESLTSVLTKAGLQALTIESVDAASCAERVAKLPDKHYCVVLNASGRLRGTLRLVMSEPEALQLSLVQVPESSKRSAELDEAQRGAAAELLNQAAGIVSALWGPGVARLEIAPTPADDVDPEAICGGLRVSAETFTPILITLGPSSEFAESLEALAGDSSGKVRPKSSTALANRSAGPSPNLDLLFDVQLEATIRFGTRQLLLRDILSMSPGAAIGLDREIDEPADLLVAGRLVARGEVVVVDGNFGLRITEVTSSNHRAELLPS